MGNSFISLNLGKTNSYLLKANRGYLLIDTGYEKYYNQFLKELDKNNIDVKEISYLVITHHHDDHSGFTNQLIKASELKIIAHELANELLKTGQNDKTRGGGYINKRIYYLSKLYKLFNPDWTLTFQPVFLREKDILIDDDNEEVLREIGIEGKILYTPGHTADSISVLLDDGVIFCGDAAMSWPLWAGTKYSTIFVTDVDIFYKSWNKIIKSGAKNIHPSHGTPFHIEKLKKHIESYTNESLVKFF